ncbi:MAG: hypothetical protein ACE37F_22250 [Nannocystaceae bacterium]|nr:hypothetical protein [bacterium]
MSFRTISLSALLLVAVPACDSTQPEDAPAGDVDFGAAGKADAEGALAVLGEFSTRLGALPTSAEIDQPLRDSDQLPDLTSVADLYDRTFETGGAVRAWLDASGVTEDDVHRAAMFASAHEYEVRDDVATHNGVEWTSDDIEAVYALAWLLADEDLRLSIGDGSDELNPALFHVAFTQLLAEGFTVVSGRVDTAGAVYDGFELEPEVIDRDRAEAILRHDVADAAAYHLIFASITTTRGFASERYILATDANDEIIAGYWTPSNDVFPSLHPTRLWIAPERPREPAAPVSFEQLDELAAAFGAEIPPPTGDTWMYTGDPVPFTENEFHCAKVAMEISERFEVADITVRAEFSPVDGDSWNHDLQVSLHHRPPGNGPSLVHLAGGDSDERPWDAQTGEWTTSAFNFEGSESASGPWELRVCDVGSFGDDRDEVTGFVDAFEIEFHTR